MTLLLAPDFVSRLIKIWSGKQVDVVEMGLDTQKVRIFYFSLMDRGVLRVISLINEKLVAILVSNNLLDYCISTSANVEVKGR